MSFESGSLSFRMFRLAKDIPCDCIERFSARACPPLSTLGQTPISGWVTGRHDLDRTITADNAYMAGHLRMALAKVERKIPASLLKAEMRMEELAWQQAHGMDIDRRSKSELRKDITDRLQANAQPVIKGIGLLHAPGSNFMFAEAVTDKQVDALEMAWRETMGYGLVDVTPVNMAIYSRGMDTRAFLPTSFSSDIPDDACDHSVGCDFLTWLWYISEAGGGIMTIDGQPWGLMIEGPLRFIGCGQGARLVAIGQGCPEISAEAKIAMAAGKKLNRARITFARGNDTWRFSLDAEDFIFRGLTLPEGEKLDAISRFQERMQNLLVFKSVFMGIYDRFLDCYARDKWPAEVQAIRRWAVERPGRI